MLIVTLPPAIADRPLFQPGRIVITPAAKDEILCRYDGDPSEVALGFVIRHLGGDWQNLSAHDQAANHRAAKQGARVLSAFPLEAFESEKELGQQPQQIWIITEADRSVTTILLPEDY